MCFSEHAPRDPSRVLERRHALADIVASGTGVTADRPRVDQHGRFVHPEADHFLRDHNEAKRILIKAAKDDIDLRTWIRNKEARQLLFRKGRFQEI